MSSTKLSDPQVERRNYSIHEIKAGCFLNSSIREERFLDLNYGGNKNVDKSVGR